jgi:non-canonical (house-cleaning) NTP pyrophosphatase
MSLLTGQTDVSPRRGFPVDDVGQSSTTISITGETVSLYYSNAGVETVDAGQAAGVAVAGYLAYENIKNKSGKLGATPLDTSLAFTAGVFTTEKKIDWSTIESVDSSSFLDRLTACTAGLDNGEYVVDYVNGILYGLKATTGTSLAAAAYKIQSGVTASSSTVTPNVNLNQVAGTTTATGNGVVGAGVQRVAVASDNTPFPVKIDQTTNGTTNAVYLMGQLVNVKYDNVAVSWNAGTFTETFLYKLVAATVATVTVVYTDATKQQIVTVALT